MDYISLNRQTYDNTAEEFKQKITLRLNWDENITNKLDNYINVNNAEVLDIWPSNGQCRYYYVIKVIL